jgi:hypothetical protein
MMTDEEAAAMFREDAIAAGIPEWMTPNDIAFALHDWLSSVPENPSDPLWREVWFLLIGYEISPNDYPDDFPFYTDDFLRLIEPPTDWEDFYQRRAEVCRGVLCRKHSSTRRSA